MSTRKIHAALLVLVVNLQQQLLLSSPLPCLIFLPL